MSLNKKAIQLLEDNDYETALSFFQQAVKEQRDVQSLTNLAWFYYREEDADEIAIELLIEAVRMNPTTYFPYNLLGEIYLKKGMWQNASIMLRQAIEIEPTTEACFNLGAVMYQLNNFEQAAIFYKRSAGDSDYALYSYVKCLIGLGKIQEAKQKLSTFTGKEDDFVGEIEVAELYMELGCYDLAVSWYEKGWTSYWHQPSWISGYVYSLLETNQIERAIIVQKEALQRKNEELEESYEEQCDEHWTEHDKHEYINTLREDKAEFEQMISRISNGYIPSAEFNPSIRTRCYLFGCVRHNYPEYVD